LGDFFHLGRFFSLRAIFFTLGDFFHFGRFFSLWAIFFTISSGHPAAAAEDCNEEIDLQLGKKWRRRFWPM
jgi:hypothetical protein